MVASERDIRWERIEGQLREAGWSIEIGNLVNEYYFPKTPPRTVKESLPSTTSSSSQKLFSSYVMLGNDRQPLGVFEAKEGAPLEDLEQVVEYADSIFERTGKQPFIFLSNGDETYFWDREYYPPRKVSNFYRLEDMERLRELRLYAQPIHLIQSDRTIVDREYQLQAVQTVVDGIRQRKHKFLLVMATGTGKTRTVIALIDRLIRAKRIRRVLFLADRRELVRQANQAFKEFLPSEPRHWIENGVKKDDATIHLATYPGMMQVLSQVSTGYYDLIVADESHRSIYKHYRTIFEHLDAIQIGLTATPTDFIEHNTFELFDCFDDIPTFEYSFEDAIAEDKLVNFKVLEARTHFQIEGIRGNELPAEVQQQMDQRGVDLGEINFEGSDLERKVTNTGTNDRLVMEFMIHAYTDAVGKPAKSIIFAVSHRHALELLESFDRLYPGLQNQGFAKVIDSRVMRSEKVLEDFKTKDMPRVAISVDMLDTGIDVPAIQNLVFAKPVYSEVKFWQMIGRGTRIWHNPDTGERKNDFLIIDHWENFRYFGLNPEGKVGYPDEPLQTRLFRLRLRRLALAQERGDESFIEQTRESIASMLTDLSRTDNIHVNDYRTYLEQEVFNDLNRVGRDNAKQ
jgi:type I restriction enzyme R subunit